MIEFLAGFLCGLITLGTIWASREAHKLSKKPPRHVIYRKGQPPEVILR